MTKPALLSSVLLAAALAGCAAAPPPAPAPDAAGPELTLVTLNLWHDQRDWPMRQPHVLRELRRLDADVIALQEVLQHETLPNQAETIARELGYAVHFVSTDDAQQARRYGNAILTRHPVLARNATPLAPRSDFRTAAHVRLNVDGHEVDVYNTHLHHTGEGGAIRREQLEDLLRFVERTRGDGPALLAGDFNAVPDAPEMQALDAHFLDVYGTLHPQPDAYARTTLNTAFGHTPRRIDHVYAERGAFTLLSAAIELDEQGADGHWPSDHFGVVARLRITGAPGALAAAAATRAADEAFLDTLQHRTFRWFWETTNPTNGLVPDRWPTESFSSVAAVGFGLTAYPVGVERGWVTREQAAERVLTTLRFLWRAPQGPEPRGMTGYRGFYYHFLDMQTGQRFGTVELSTIDTALMLGGALFCQSYFDRDDAREAEIRALADSIYRRVEWDWVDPAQKPRMGMGWHPETGFIPHAYRGYDEAMLLYVLAMGSPTHPIPPEAWQAFTSTHPWREFYGQAHVNFAPLFGHQYSHVWIDFRGIQDEYMRGRGIDYFENSRRATLAQRAYAIDNPMRWRGYGPDVWGLTASDGPVDTTLTVNGEPRTFWSYRARGAAATQIEDDGTLVPTAAGGSIPFAPEETIRALRTMRERYGEHLWGEYGFFDAFNPTFQWTDVRLQHGKVVPGVGWFDTDYLGIDQGPILLMAENHRSGLVWEHMRRNPHIRRGLERAGFTGGWLQAEAAR